MPNHFEAIRDRKLILLNANPMMPDVGMRLQREISWWTWSEGAALGYVGPSLSG